MSCEAAIASEHYLYITTPTVSPAKNSPVYFISIAYIAHPVWRSHREEAKRGPPSGHRIPRIEGAMMSLLRDACVSTASAAYARVVGRMAHHELDTCTNVHLDSVEYLMRRCSHCGSSLGVYTS